MKTTIYTRLLLLIISMTSFSCGMTTVSPTMSPIRQTMSPTMYEMENTSNLRGSQTSGYRPSRISSEDEDEANNKFSTNKKVVISIVSVSVGLLIAICVLCVFLKLCVF